MLFARFTETLGGLELVGDCLDFTELSAAIVEKVSPQITENDPEAFMKVIVMSFSRELHEATKGERGYSYVDNGVTEEIRKKRKELFPLKNVYLRIRVDIVTIALTVVALQHLAKESLFFPSHTALSAARHRFYAIVMDALRQELPEKEFRRVERSFGKFHANYKKDYLPQYYEEQTAKYLLMDRDKRSKALPGTLTRVLEMGDAYQKVLNDIKAEAKESGCAVEQIKPFIEYPKNFEW